MGVLEKAMKLANQDPDTVGDDDEDEGQSEAARVGGREKSAGVVLMQLEWFAFIKGMFHCLPQQLSGQTVD